MVARTIILGDYAIIRPMLKCNQARRGVSGARNLKDKVGVAWR